MKTRDFINALVADRRREPAPAGALLRFMLPAFLLAAAALLGTAGVRADIGMVAATARVLFKWSLAIALVVCAAGAFLRVARPEAKLGEWALGLTGIALVLAIGVAVELAVLPREEWMVQARGVNASWCLRMIPMLAAAPFVAAFAVLRRAAPARPAIAGAMAGLLAGSLGAALYALHCTDDSPLFVASWYGLAVLAITGIGALVGRRLLRW